MGGKRITKESKEHFRAYLRERRASLKASGKCIDCAVSRTVTGRVRCYGCQQKQKNFNVYKRITFSPPAEALSKDEIYGLANSEREVVSWAWRNPV